MIQNSSHAMAEAGARVVCTGRAEAPLEATVAAIRAAGGTALAVPQDITAPGAAQTIVARTLEALYDGLSLNILMYPGTFTRDRAKAEVRAYLASVYPTHFPMPEPPPPRDARRGRKGD